MAVDPALPDIDPQETREWLQALEDVLRHEGPERARFLLERVLAHASAHDAAPDGAPGGLTTPYLDTLPVDAQPPYPGDPELEEKLLAMLRWNAMLLVVKTNKRFDGLGGHIATYQSVAHLFEVGFQHFWHAPSDDHGGDLVFFQGHASPGIYARGLLDGTFSTEQMDRFRREVEPGGLSSYPHPWLMPEYWQFATVSMGLGPLMAIYQARFLKYLHARGLADTVNRHVWCFCGDGEMDEPESQGALHVAKREGLDNLIFVVNCNLQRLDGPVRGNGKVIQELERNFRGMGWNVLKVMWSSAWDELLANDDGRLADAMLTTVDGDWQTFVARGGAYFRQHFWQRHGLADRVAHLSDEQLERLDRGGHDPLKVHAAYRHAVDQTDGPTVVLAHTVKGYGMGDAGEALNITHQQKKMAIDQVRAFRDRFAVPVDSLPEDDAGLKDIDWLVPADDSPEVRYLRERRAALGGSFPQRRTADSVDPLPIPPLSKLGRLLKSTGDKTMSTTQAFNQVLRVLAREKGLAERLVPILADEARTFGMEGLFRQMGIYAPDGQLYVAEDNVDGKNILGYVEATDGQVLQEGINEAGAVASWAAAGMSYSTHGLHMVPFYIYYSMFGFQRIGDFIWAAADMQARGFLLGATSGRTTLNGEGLQHEDGHSHLIAATVPNCVSYDPTFHYETAVILHDGLRRMYGEANENVFYYVTLLNEDYPHPDPPEGYEEGVKRGLYRFAKASSRAKKKRVQLLGSGAILREVIAAAEL
ncbi:MAG: pyruvate dehydrogenase (acetyl-transferring), homodimeric type, partial [Acidobacteriota bacterium]